MSKYLLKIRLLFIPFVLVSLSLIIGYTFLHWLLFVEFNLLSLNEELVDYWLPLGLVILACYIWIYPRIKLLELNDAKDKGPFIFYFVFCITTLLSLAFLQQYLITATGKLTNLNSTDQISDKPLTKYYKLKKHYVDKANRLTYRTALTSGRSNENLTFHLYIVCPLVIDSAYASSIWKTAPVPNTWLGKDYRKTISNNLNDGEKQREAEIFNNESLKEFEKDDPNKFVYLDRIGRTEAYKGYRSAVDNVTELQGKQLFIFEGKNESFENRNGDKLRWVLYPYLIGTVVWLLMILLPPISKKELAKFSNTERISEAKTFLKYISSIRLSDRLMITQILIAVNTIIFVVMVFMGLGVVSFYSKDLLSWGANYGPAVLEGQWWRLLTCTFIHGGLMHLVMNMTGLFFVGLLLEPIIGKYRHLTAYLICGIMASIVSIYWHSATVSVGASGAIFGLFGVLIALLTTNRIPSDSKRQFFIITLGFVGINLLFGFLGGGIDNAAHIGGLLSGIILGYIFYFFIPPPKPKRKYKRKSKVISETQIPLNEQPVQ